MEFKDFLATAFMIMPRSFFRRQACSILPKGP
jgi:hypothetical protein